MVPIDAFAGRSMFQLAFVVRNLEDALERYSAAFDAAPWRCWTLGAVEHEETEYRGRPTSFSSRLALNDSSPQVELIEPVTGPSAHQEWLDNHGEGLTTSESSSSPSETPWSRWRTLAIQSCTEGRAWARSTTAPGPTSTPPTHSA